VSNFSEGLAGVQLAGKWGFVNQSGIKVVPCKYDEIIEPFSDGKAKVILNGKRLKR
jgi:hypothetical protein